MNKTASLYNTMLVLDYIGLHHLVERHSKSKIFIASKDTEVLRKIRDKGLNAYQDKKGNVIIDYTK